MTTLPIQFLLHQLANNEQDRERFNLVSPSVRVFQAKYLNFEINFSENYQRAKTQLSFRGENLHKQTDIVQEKIIRTCLSSKNGKAVLEVLDGVDILTLRTEILHNAFDFPLRNGGEWNHSLESLHKKMLEHVPEYITFCEEQAKKN